MSDLNRYQEFIAAINAEYELGDKELAVAALGLAGEVGEVTELLKKYIRDGQIDKEALKKELGDVLAYLALVGSLFDITLEDIKDANEEKLNVRLNKGTLRGSGNER